MADAWRIHVAAVSAESGFLWVCRGKYDCCDSTGWIFHDGTQTHEGPRWCFSMAPPRWWQRGPLRTRTFEEAQDAAQLFLDRAEEVVSLNERLRSISDLLKTL